MYPADAPDTGDTPPKMSSFRVAFAMHSLVTMMNDTTATRDEESFDDREISWFLRGETKRRAILPPEPPSHVPSVDDSIADHWFR